MKTLLFKKTTDADLSKGITVKYANAFGDFLKDGIIEDIILDANGIAQYKINGFLYLANELKLIEVEPIDNFDELKEAVNKQRSFVPVTERLYYYALEVLPPIYLKNNTFQMGECYSDDLYYTFGEKNGKYYGCLCNKNFSLNNF